MPNTKATCGNTSRSYKISTLQGKTSSSLLLYKVHLRVLSQNPNLKSLRDETLNLAFNMLQEDHETLERERERPSTNEEIRERR
jgi:hypothetical protein